MTGDTTPRVALMELSDWVNQARNVCWFSGYYWGIDGGYMLLRQVADAAKIVRIKVSPGFRAPSATDIIEVKCHCFAEAGEVQLQAVRIKRASVGAMPRRVALLDALRKHDKNYNPFEALQQVREEIKASLKIDDEIVDAIIRQARAVQGRDSGFINKLILSGFVGFKGFVQPSEGRERGHVRLMLQQHANPERAIPVQILGADARFGQTLQANMPINIVAEAQFDVDSDGRAALSIVANKNNVGRSGEQDFEHRRFPKWWVEMLTNIYTKLKQQKTSVDADSLATGQVKMATSPDRASGVQVMDAAESDALRRELGVDDADL